MTVRLSVCLSIDVVDDDNNGDGICLPHLERKMLNIVIVEELET